MAAAHRFRAVVRTREEETAMTASSVIIWVVAIVIVAAIALSVSRNKK
ncbi:hypothetical protein [Streptomyces coffeae]|uniref:SCO1431 family membrane protein n=1 Tax=Streptomyces coffeae TaxID=621382 RepID=A0ABS1N843_9ACTN|nr:hypothetical protein [Streptomyces coffeae]MBL1096026.1 hypothetical protein [Streptomyces coffeae]